MNLLLGVRTGAGLLGHGKECPSPCPSWERSRFIMVVKKQRDDEGCVLGVDCPLF